MKKEEAVEELHDGRAEEERTEGCGEGGGVLIGGYHEVQR